MGYIKLSSIFRGCGEHSYLVHLLLFTRSLPAPKQLLHFSIDPSVPSCSNFTAQLRVWFRDLVSVSLGNSLTSTACLVYKCLIVKWLPQSKHLCFFVLYKVHWIPLKSARDGRLMLITCGDILNITLFSFPFDLSMIWKLDSISLPVQKRLIALENLRKKYILCPLLGCSLGAWIYILETGIKEESLAYITFPSGTAEKGKRFWNNSPPWFSAITAPLGLPWGPRQAERFKNCLHCGPFCFLYSYLVPAIRNTLKLFLTVKCCPVEMQHFIWAYKI